jgi:hypothetical protein
MKDKATGKGKMVCRGVFRLADKEGAVEDLNRICKRKAVTWSQCPPGVGLDGFKLYFEPILGEGWRDAWTRYSRDAGNAKLNDVCSELEHLEERLEKSDVELWKKTQSLIDDWEALLRSGVEHADMPEGVRRKWAAVQHHMQYYTRAAASAAKRLNNRGVKGFEDADGFADAD